VKPEDVPAELAALGTHAVDMHPSTSFLAPCESLARAVLAAVLPEHEKQVRARLADELRQTYGPLDVNCEEGLFDEGVLAAIATVLGES
jgi:hypothetical protein